MTIRDITRRLRMMNRTGTVITIYSGGGCVQQIMPDSITPLKVEGASIWLLLKQIGYHEDVEQCWTVKVVDHLVNAYLEDEKDGEQWLTITLQDDRDHLYLVEIVEPFCDPEAHRKWRKWQNYRKENKEKLAAIDVLLMEQHRVIADNWEN